MNVKEKAGETCQMRVKETNANKPSMRCQKIKKRSKLDTCTNPGKVQWKPESY